jgi:hypothetical protein
MTFLKQSIVGIKYINKTLIMAIFCFSQAILVFCIAILLNIYGEVSLIEPNEFILKSETTLLGILLLFSGYMIFFTVKKIKRERWPL